MKSTLKICMLTLILFSCSKSNNKSQKAIENKQEFVISEYPSVPNYYKILEKTTYHGSDIEGVKADNWVGLYKNNNGFYIQDTEVYTRTVHDNVLDEEWQNTGKEVVISNDSDNCIALLGNFSWKCEEPKKVKQIDLSKQFQENKSFTFNFLGKKYNWNIKENGCVTISTELNGKKFEQLICSHRFDAILFAGDLNSDGKLDLILDTSEFDSSAKQLTFFQSFQDNSELLFELVALHHSTSC